MRASPRIPALAACVVALGASGTALAAFPEDPPDDPLYDASPLPNFANEQWDLASPGGGFDRGISVDRAWPLSTGRGATVADIDLGVDYAHPDLAGRWRLNPGENGGGRRSNGVDDDRNGYVDDWRGWDFYERDNDATTDTGNSHGTQVAGILGAAADNGIAIAGIAPDARILPVRTADNILHQGNRVAQAITYAADEGADAISMSLGADSFSRRLRQSVEYAYRRGAVSVVAAGNEFHFHHHYPQIHDHALAVGGIVPDTADVRDKDPNLAPVASDFDVKAAYSNYGPHLDVVAPTQVPAITFGGGSELKWSGTSAATPHVAGVVTLVASRAREKGLRLSAGELMQIIRMGADDLDEPSRGYAPGWDLLSGWGRVNAFESVRMARRGAIPPVPDIRSPGWYRPTRGRSVAVRASVDGRSATSWKLMLGKGEQPSEWQTIASGSDTGGATRRLARIGLAQLRTGEEEGLTLLLRARDSRGNVGEDRAFFYPLARSQRVHRGFPKNLGTSGEASPALADLDRDGSKDIVLATSDGLLRAYSGRRGRMLPGWPKRMRRAAGAAPTARRLGPVRAGFAGTPAIGDVAGGPGLEVVATGLDGRVYAWDRRGWRVRGFPFRIDQRRPADDGRTEGAIYASPALADLRRERRGRDRKLEIVFGAADQRIYAISGRARTLPGWPVLARSDGDAAKILSSPAIGDLDGDDRPDVVEGTAEAYGSVPNTSGRVYAFDRKGRLLPGWPVEPQAISADGIPLAGEGVPASPSLADVDSDGDDEVAIAAFTGEPELYDGDGSSIAGAGASSHFQTAGRGATSPATAPSALALGANGAFGRNTPGGPLRFFGGLVDSRLAQAQVSPASDVPFEHLLGGWDAASGSWLSSFPIPTEGWEILTSPALADVDGDGAAEVINGTSGNRVHAFRADGSEPPGWPKQAAGWLLASPAVGDVDGDGRAEVVAVTRDGYLFVWDTPAPAAQRGEAEWPSFRHDHRNTGNYGG